MTAFVTGADGRTYQHRTAEPEPVFIAEQPRIGSACGTPHSGHATLLAWLEPMMGGERLARVRMRGGGLVEVRASAICPAAGLATRRILPRPSSLDRRTA